MWGGENQNLNQAEMEVVMCELAQKLKRVAVVIAAAREAISDEALLPNLEFATSSLFSSYM